MNRFEKEVLAAAETLNVRASRLPETTGRALHARMRELFGSAREGAATWERIDGGTSVKDPAGWKVAARLVGESPCLLTFEPHQDDSVIEFCRGADLESVLGECAGFVFYLCDPQLKYAMCFNDHDYLIAWGEAAGWLPQSGG